MDIFYFKRNGRRNLILISCLVVLTLTISIIFIKKKTVPLKSETQEEMSGSDIQNKLNEQQARIDELQNFKDEQQKLEEEKKKQEENKTTQTEQQKIIDEQNTNKERLIHQCEEKKVDCKSEIGKKQYEISDYNNFIKARKHDIETRKDIIDECNGNSQCAEPYVKAIETHKKLIEEYEDKIDNVEDEIKKIKSSSDCLNYENPCK